MTRPISGRERLLAAAVGTGAAAYALVVLLASLSAASRATAWMATATSFGYVSAGSSDYWYNYDFNSYSANSSNVDSPVRFLFDSNAEVDKAKDAVDGCGGDPGGTTATFRWRTMDSGDQGTHGACRKLLQRGPN